MPSFTNFFLFLSRNCGKYFVAMSKFCKWIYERWYIWTAENDMKTVQSNKLFYLSYHSYLRWTRDQLRRERLVCIKHDISQTRAVEHPRVWTKHERFLFPSETKDQQGFPNLVPNSLQPKYSWKISCINDLRTQADFTIVVTERTGGTEREPKELKWGGTETTSGNETLRRLASLKSNIFYFSVLKDGSLISAWR